MVLSINRSHWLAGKFRCCAYAPARTQKYVASAACEDGCFNSSRSFLKSISKQPSSADPISRWVRHCRTPSGSSTPNQRGDGELARGRRPGQAAAALVAGVLKQGGAPRSRFPISARMASTRAPSAPSYSRSTDATHCKSPGINCAPFASNNRDPGLRNGGNAHIRRFLPWRRLIFAGRFRAVQSE